MKSGPPGEVLVVGAGLAGLLVAYRLHRAGRSVRVFEAASKVGGRIETDSTTFGVPVELGAEYIGGLHQRVQGLAAELGLPLVDLHEVDPPGRAYLAYIEGRMVGAEEGFGFFGEVAQRAAADRARISMGEVGYRTPGDAASLDAVPVTEYLARLGVSSSARGFIEAQLSVENGMEAGEQSSLNLLAFLDEALGPFDPNAPPEPEGEEFAEEGDGEAPQGPPPEVDPFRFKIRGGNDQLPHALAAALGTRVELSTALEDLRRAPDGDWVLTLRRSGTSQEVRSREVVLALPFTALRRAIGNVELPALKRAAIEQLGYGTNAKLLVGFEGRPWIEQLGTNPAVISDQFHYAWEGSLGYATRHGVLTSFRGGRLGVDLAHGEVEPLAEAWLEALAPVMPGLSARRIPGKVVRADWPVRPFIGGSYATYRTGQWTSFGGAEAEAFEGLHFAGEHTARTNRGLMEGACESAERVVQELLGAVQVQHREVIG